MKTQKLRSLMACLVLLAAPSAWASNSSLDFDFELVDGVEGNIYVKEISDGDADGDPALKIYRSLCAGPVVRDGISYKTLYSRDGSLDVNCKAIEDEGKAKCKITVRASNHTTVDIKKIRIGYQPIDIDDAEWLRAQFACTPKTQNKVLTMDLGDRDTVHRMRLLIDFEKGKESIRFMAEKL